MTYAKIQELITKYNAGLISKAEMEIIKTFQALDKELTSLLTDIYKKYDLPIMVNGIADGNATMAFMRARVVNSDLGKITRLTALENQVKQILGPALIKKDRFMEQMTRIAAQNGYYQNLWAVETVSGVSLDFALLNEKSVSMLSSNQFSKFADSRLKEMDTLKLDRSVVIGKLNKEIEMALGRGDNLVTIGKRVDQIMGFRDATGKLLVDKLSKRGVTYDSMRIVRTEMMRAYSLGMQEQLKETSEQLEAEGITPRLRWVASLDQRTRPDHASMDGEESDSEGQFTLPDGTVGIQHNFGIPAQDINCRCTTIQVIDGLEPVVRRTRDEGVIPYQTFEEWWYKTAGEDTNIYNQKYSFNK